MKEIAAPTIKIAKQTKRPRLGFLGVGWIGRNRLQAIAETGACDIAAIVEPNAEMAEKAQELALGAALIGSLGELLESEITGIAIATPSALHSEQAIAALERGISVFCQKPLGRNAAETRRVVEAARENDCLLAVDFSYRFIDGMQRVREMIQAGDLGTIFAADLIFHNAYGPDKEWFFDRKLSGGGCVTDLGVHLVDLALWTLDFPAAADISGRLYANGKLLRNLNETVEDYATARIDFENGATANLACSWNLHAGREAEISATFYGTNGGATLRNLDSSFFDFTAERFSGVNRSKLTEAADDDQKWTWGGRAIVDWAGRLAAGEKFNNECEKLIDVAAILETIYRESCRSKDYILCEH